MIRIVCAATLMVVAGTAAWGQSTTSNRAAAEVDENLQPGGERTGTPGDWVRAALARHRDLIDKRVNAPRGGQAGGTLNDDQRTGTTGVSGSGSGGLLDLVGGLGDLSNIGGLLGGLNGGSTGTTGANQSELDLLQQLIALRDANTKPNNSAQDLNDAPGKTGTQQVRQFGGAIARLPKAEERLQQDGSGTTPEQEKFLVRWGNAMLQSAFSALTFGLQSRDFIEAIKDGLRPLFLPPADTDGNGDGDGDGENGGSDNGSGSGIEDLDGTGGGDDDGGGSII